jgi:hypothetical protein
VGNYNDLNKHSDRKKTPGLTPLQKTYMKQSEKNWEVTKKVMPAAAEVGASMIPGVGEAMDVRDLKQGYDEGDTSKMGWAAAGLVAPFVTGKTLNAARAGYRKTKDSFWPTYAQDTQVFNSEKHARFYDLAELQRDKPEQAMLEVQREMDGGILPNMLEHVGDLTHRMTEMFGKWDDTSMGREYVEGKVRNALRTLRNDYGATREMNENLDNNMKYWADKDPDFDPGVKGIAIDKKLAKYSAEHSKLPVYNDAQYNAREAAVALGKRDLTQAQIHLEKLEEWLKDPKVWEEKASELNPHYSADKKSADRYANLIRSGE